MLLWDICRAHEFTHRRTNSGSRMTPHLCKAAQSALSMHHVTQSSLTSQGWKKIKFKGFKSFQAPPHAPGTHPTRAQAP